MKNFKLIVRDVDSKILHEPEFDTLAESEEMKARIEEFNEWNFPEGFTVTIEDNTALNDAEKSKENQKKIGRTNRVSSFKNVDWNTITFDQLKQIVKDLVDDNVKDEV